MESVWKLSAAFTLGWKTSGEKKEVFHLRVPSVNKAAFLNFRSKPLKGDETEVDEVGNKQTNKKKSEKDETTRIGSHFVFDF